MFIHPYNQKRWEALQNNEGHLRPYSGNRMALVLRDHNLLLLTLYQVVFLKANAAKAKVNAYLYNI